jgi:2-keto-3-deoxy-L-rhamnonate aldolase RhmA
MGGVKLSPDRRFTMSNIRCVWVVLWAIATFASLVEAQQVRVRQNRLISQLEQGQSVLGLTIENKSVESGRWLRASGLDFVVIDLEHQLYDFTAMRELVLGIHEQPFSNEVIEHVSASAPASNSPPFFPPLEAPTVLVKLAKRGDDGISFDVRHSLKMGAMGVFVPFVESGAAVEAAVEAAKNAESIRYILRGSRDVWRTQNQPWPLYESGEFLIGAMIESHAGEENIDEILGTPGLSMVWLAHVSSEEVERSILTKCLERGIFVASPHEDPSDFAADVEAGYRIFFFGWDREIFYRGLGDVLAPGREAIGRP